ncbi:hypothetical protein [Hominenteromicrobium sp.]|uniref:hypothetical protein n=1 Tax=Hominenteromicrobium sp. TaxID=3073581 RepID=UPI003A94EAED
MQHGRGKIFRCTERKVIHFFAKRGKKLRETFSLISKFSASAGHIFACGGAEFWANSVRFFAISKKDLRRKPPGQTEKARNALFQFAFASIPFLRKNGRSVKITDFLGTP